MAYSLPYSKFENLPIFYLLWSGLCSVFDLVTPIMYETLRLETLIYVSPLHKNVSDRRYLANSLYEKGKLAPLVSGTSPSISISEPLKICIIIKEWVSTVATKLRCIHWSAGLAHTGYKRYLLHFQEFCLLVVKCGHL